MSNENPVQNSGLENGSLKMGQFPSEVSFDVRVTVKPTYMGYAVECLERLAHNVGISIDFPVPDALPYGNEEADVWT